ncbi:uncharacterized protein N7487_000036 [Penicillium crustosum]|uniref:uncharacterized protein n=1 Tax=Penicillium crustosum TaxID=36656 RepID=UPI0023995897|nr:uncharacterized protein N7487_000036 [Penicillium crustosum]KAJ5416486.1 hypothetical protein N7487_000036 [Penicillium crustosum]
MTEVDDDLRVSMEYSRSQGTRILQIHYDRGLTWGKLRRQYCGPRVELWFEYGMERYYEDL